jgi:hypothetical protein
VAVSMKMAVFWAVEPFRLVWSLLPNQSDDGGSKDL